jgi:hypothetical protein
MDSEWNRYYIKIRTVLGINAKTICEELTDENIERVRQGIECDPHSTYDDIMAETSLSYGAIERIIHDCLKMRKVTSW